MLVAFSTHAADRLQSRLGIRVNTGTEVDITSNFKKVESYTHYQTGHTIEQWINVDASTPVVLTIDSNNGSVVTVMTTGPIVDALYAKIKH
jgi:hypothetical protein